MYIILIFSIKLSTYMMKIGYRVILANQMLLYGYTNIIYYIFTLFYIYVCKYIIYFNISQIVNYRKKYI